MPFSHFPPGADSGLIIAELPSFVVGKKIGGAIWQIALL
jgi:hypothetical protein